MDVIAELMQAPADATRAAFVDFVRTGGEAVARKSGGDEHLTASCFVLTSDLRRVLLTHHRKGRFWVQFGGHLEPPDTSLAAAARRETVEESGMESLSLLGDRVVDLDRHDLHGGFACAAHWDVGFVAFASDLHPAKVSSESFDVRWFEVGDLPQAVPSNFPTRLATVRARVAGWPSPAEARRPG